MKKRNSAYTLVEVLVVVLLIGIVAMLVVPKIAGSSEDARDAALTSDLQTIRRQLELYRQQHSGSGPEYNERGRLDTAKFVARMTGKTTSAGAVSGTGTCGPYLTEWPANPFCSPSVAQTVLCGSMPSAPRNDASGWYYDVRMGQMHVNSSRGATSVDPPD